MTNEKKRELLQLVGETLGHTEPDQWKDYPDEYLDKALEGVIVHLCATLKRLNKIIKIF